ncbi:hypothetical protein [Aliihoeflea sp. 2WW]|uniref:hypothetical protein n=1 Tax=Aliihoeflea sp. 2WW TaxID=1381123 RepID=UPI0004BC9CBB|nr:hypothetical protein [Aliihoeflea sp. 2WW]
MKTLDELRAELVRTGQLDPRDLRRIRWLSPGRHEHNERIMDALGWGHDLSSRMRECGEVDAHNNMRYCRIPHCSRCSMVRRGKETKKAIRESFLGVPNERLAFVTILLPVTSQLGLVADLMKREKRRLINLLKRKRRQDSRWNGVHMTGFWEIDRIDALDLPKLSQQKQRALGELGAPVLAMAGGTIWIPHVHVIVDLGGVSLDELRKALRGDGRRTAYQLHVQGFRANLPVNENLKKAIRYCLKFRLEQDYKDGYGLDVTQLDEDDQPRQRQWWPDKDIAAYVGWAKQTKGGFRCLRFEIGRAGDARGAHDAKVRAFEEDRISMRARRKAPKPLNAEETDEDFELWLSSEEIDVSVSFKKTDACGGVAAGAGCMGLGDVGPDEGRYKEPLLDTNWLPDSCLELLPVYICDPERKNVI